MTTLSPPSVTLPCPRGPLSRFVIERLAEPPHDVGGALPPADDPLTGEDAPLALYVLYELHYRSFAEVDDRWEWEPSLLAARARLEARLEERLRAEVAAPEPEADLAGQLFALVADDDGPSLSRRLAGSGTREEGRELLVHRSAYHLKEADPHTWAIPRLAGAPKAALVEIQSDEYGGGRPEWVHAALFARAMRGAGLDDAYGAYLDHIPGTTLSLVNLMSLLGLHRRLRGAIVGHLAVLEMTSSAPMRRYAAAFRRMGLDDDAVTFFDEHVEADAVHEQVAAHDLAGRLAADEPALARDILFGAAAVLHLEAVWARGVIGAWDAGGTSLRRPLDAREG